MSEIDKLHFVTHWYLYYIYTCMYVDKCDGICRRDLYNLKVNIAIIFNDWYGIKFRIMKFIKCIWMAKIRYNFTAMDGVSTMEFH